MWRIKITICCDDEKQARAQIHHFFVDFEFCAIHDSLGLVNIEVSLFCVDDNDNNRRQTNYFTLAHARRVAITPIKPRGGGGPGHTEHSSVHGGYYDCTCPSSA